MTSPRIVRPIAHARAATARLGFSMVELMIAIMILGLGLVMAATIFPVGLDMTRETLQSNTALTMVDNAVETIQLKIPSWNPNLYRPAPMPDPSVRLIPRSIVPPTDFRLPTSGSSTLNGQLGIEDDANISGPDVTAFNELGNPFHLLGSDDAGWLKSLNGSPATANILAARTLAFTGHSMFDADMDSDLCYVIRAQNLPANYRDRIANRNTPVFEVPTTAYFGPPNGRSPVRLHLTDVIDIRANLPADLLRAACKAYNDNSSPTRWMAESEIGQAAETARYSWTAFARRVPNSNRMKLTIAVTYRGELGSRYAPQRDQRSNPIDPLSMSANELEKVPGNDLEDTLMFPRPDPDQTKHTLFPQPWLVVVTRINEAQGIVECTNDIARLLPANSRFVIARDGTFPAGTVLTVISSTVNQSEIGDKPAANHQMATLRIPANAAEDGTGRADFNVPVWIFPPAVVSTDGVGEFAGRSPVVAVFEREVVLP